MKLNYVFLLIAICVCVVFGGCTGRGVDRPEFKLKWNDDSLLVQRLVPESLVRNEVVFVDKEMLVSNYYEGKRMGPFYKYDMNQNLLSYKFFLLDTMKFSCEYDYDQQIYDLTGSPLIRNNFSAFNHDGFYNVELRDYFANVPNMSVQICRLFGDSIIHCSRHKLSTIEYPYRDTIRVDTNAYRNITSHFTFYQEEFKIELFLDGYNWILE